MEIEIQQFLSGLDQLFATGQAEKAGAYLEEWFEKAEHMGDVNGMFTILNEMMGYYRSVEKEDRALFSASKCVQLIGQCGLQNHSAVGTMYLNIATTLCHFKRVEEAIAFYTRARENFKTYGANDATMASLYNNMAFAYVQKKEYSLAEDCYQQALTLLEQVEDNYSDKAVTYANMIDLYETMGEKEKAVCCVKQIEIELDIPESKQNGKYASACMKCANILYAYGFICEASKLEERGTGVYERA